MTCIMLCNKVNLVSITTHTTQILQRKREVGLVAFLYSGGRRGDSVEVVVVRVD